MNAFVFWAKGFCSVDLACRIWLTRFLFLFVVFFPWLACRFCFCIVLVSQIHFASNCVFDPLFCGWSCEWFFEVWVVFWATCVWFNPSISAVFCYIVSFHDKLLVISQLQILYDSMQKRNTCFIYLFIYLSGSNWKIHM